MKPLLLALLATIALDASSAQQKPKGVYSGLIRMCAKNPDGSTYCYGDPARPEEKWYHLTYIKFKGDSVYIDQEPVYFRHGDTVFSASDGGFYGYKGTFVLKGQQMLFHLSLAWTDYTNLHPKDPFLDPVKFNGLLTSKGLAIRGRFFRRTTDRKLESEYRHTFY
ncbi:hypothetical protein [Dinghuibacter silviterrae]|uniref:NlpE-like protein n=1 Tax=Dinghuibacter silviterrae TaxID=1539049 RepID=A0A4R8DWQ8_9BACT|nr:hypothetical protein [Dinghuibacter silviterrae]TDX01955.1 hypothetical protein EDB95_3002 [Dinghuibacter silviterrae]